MTGGVRGDGTIGREGDGWVARLELPPGPDGKRRRIRRRAATKAEAVAILRRLRDDYDQVDNPDGLRRTTATAVETYLNTRANQGRSAKTVKLEHWRASIITAGLGKRQIGQLTVTDCDTFLHATAKGDYGRREIRTEALRRIRRLLIRILDNERRLGNLARNVAELSIMPATHHPNSNHDDDADPDGDRDEAVRRSLTHEELGQLWRVARHPLLVIVDLCGRNGLRPSEARALRWECINLDEATITIDRQLSSTDRLVKPKTTNANRIVTIDDITHTTLTAWQAIHDAKQRRAGYQWSDGPAFVVTTRYGTPINRNNLARMLTAACEDAAIDRIVPYELRHTAITHQRLAGQDSALVADWAGTSERMVNQIYRHRLHARSDLQPPPNNGVTEGPGPTAGPNT